MPKLVGRAERGKDRLDTSAEIITRNVGPVSWKLEFYVSGEERSSDRGENLRGKGVGRWAERETAEGKYYR